MPVDANARRASRKVILVTGASGFIGRHTCRELLERGCRVRGVVRSPSASGIKGVELIVMDSIANRGAVRQAMVGVHGVIHLAGRAHQLADTASDPLAEFRRINVEGTRVVVEEAVRAGVEQLTYASSIAVVGDHHKGPVTVDTLCAPRTPYGQSKLEAENVVTTIAARAGMSATIVRPTLVYGPGMKGNPLRLFDLVASGLPLPFGRLREKKSFLYVGNLVAAIAQVVESPLSGIRVLLAADGEELSTADFVRGIARALHKPTILVPVPRLVLSAAARVGDYWPRFPLNRDVVDRLSRGLVVDTSVMRALLGGSYPFTAPEGIARTAAWYREREPS